jgi:hypothetical protein
VNQKADEEIKNSAPFEQSEFGVDQIIEQIAGHFYGSLRPIVKKLLDEKHAKLIVQIAFVPQRSGST